MNFCFLNFVLSHIRMSQLIRLTFLCVVISSAVGIPLLFNEERFLIPFLDGIQSLAANAKDGLQQSKETTNNGTATNLKAAMQKMANDAKDYFEIVYGELDGLRTEYFNCSSMGCRLGALFKAQNVGQQMLKSWIFWQ